MVVIFLRFNVLLHNVELTSNIYTSIARSDNVMIIIIDRQLKL